jgi:NAD(P)H-flavin reductase
MLLLLLLVALSHAMCSWGGIFWKGGVGYVTRDMLAAHMPAPSLGSDALIMVCGPPGVLIISLVRSATR